MKWWEDGADLYTEAEYGRQPMEEEDSPTVVESPTSEGAQGLQPGEMAASRMANQRAMVGGLEGGYEIDYPAGGLEEPSARAMVAGMHD